MQELGEFACEGAEGAVLCRCFRCSPELSENFPEEPAEADEGAFCPLKLGCEDGETSGDEDDGGAWRHNHHDPHEEDGTACEDDGGLFQARVVLDTIDDATCPGHVFAP